MPTGLHNGYPATLRCFTKYEAVGRLSAEGVAAFWEKVDKTGACWLWTASLTGGKPGRRYGQFRGMYAHRVAWILAHGSIPAGLEIGHTCHNSRCCNASHLHPCTHTENNRESADAGNFRVARPSGHKVTTEQLAEIDALLAVGGRGTKAEIARRYGVTKAWVSQYAKGQRRQYDRPAQRRKAVA